MHLVVVSRQRSDSDSFRWGTHGEIGAKLERSDMRWVLQEDSRQEELSGAVTFFPLTGGMLRKGLDAFRFFFIKKKGQKSQNGGPCCDGLCPQRAHLQRFPVVTRSGCRVLARYNFSRFSLTVSRLGLSTYKCYVLRATQCTS